MPEPDREERKETQPKSEAVERPWASNDKVQFDNVMAHCKRVDVLAEQAVANAISLAQKVGEDGLEATKQMRSAYMEQANTQNKLFSSLVEKLQEQYCENNRFTMDRLYGIYPEEAIGMGAALKAYDILLAAGWTPPSKKKE